MSLDVLLWNYDNDVLVLPSSFYAEYTARGIINACDITRREIPGNRMVFDYRLLFIPCEQEGCWWPVFVVNPLGQLLKSDAIKVEMTLNSMYSYGPFGVCIDAMYLNNQNQHMRQFVCLWLNNEFNDLFSNDVATIRGKLEENHIAKPVPLLIHFQLRNLYGFVPIKLHLCQIRHTSQ